MTKSATIKMKEGCSDQKEQIKTTTVGKNDGDVALENFYATTIIIAISSLPTVVAHINTINRVSCQMQWGFFFNYLTGNIYFRIYPYQRMDVTNRCFCIMHTELLQRIDTAGKSQFCGSRHKTPRPCKLAGTPPCGGLEQHLELFKRGCFIYI